MCWPSIGCGTKARDTGDFICSSRGALGGGMTRVCSLYCSTANFVGGMRTVTSSRSGGSITYGGRTTLVSSRGTEASGMGGLTTMHLETQPELGAQRPARSSQSPRDVRVVACTVVSYL